MGDLRAKKFKFVGYVQSLLHLYNRKKNRYLKRTGKHLLNQEEIKRRLELCWECEHFTGDRCELCGCCAGRTENHFNKLAFPTERCPKDPPAWEEVE